MIITAGTLILIILFVFFVIFSSCGIREVKHLNAQELLKRINTEPELTVINVLSKESYDNCHIKGSINIALQDLEQAVKDWDRNKNIIVYCASYKCTASADAYKQLVKLGFKKVLAYEGGIKEWQEFGYPTEGPCQ